MSTDVLIETIRHITDLSQKAAGAKDKAVLLTLPEPDGRYAIVGADGKLQIATPQRKPARHELLSIDQVPSFVADYEEAKIWVSDEGLEVVCRPFLFALSDRAVVRFSTTPDWQLLECAQGTEEARSPKATIKWLRRFEELTGDMESLIATLRRVGSRVVASTQIATERTRESIGKDIDAEMLESAGQIPDRITIMARVFTDRALPHAVAVQCLVELEPQTCQVQIVPLAGSMDAARNGTIGLITAICSQAGRTVFYGKPG